MSVFKQVIQNEAELRDILGYAGKAAQNKVIPEIDDICRAFIEKSPFLLLGSTDASGSMDVSPKGDPAGFVVKCEDGFTFYHAGDTAVFSDMQLIGQIYQPELALLPIGGLYTMDPREAAVAVRLLGVKKVIPMHYRTFPPLTGSPAQLRELTRDIDGLEVIELQPGVPAE